MISQSHWLGSFPQKFNFSSPEHSHMGWVWDYPSPPLHTYLPSPLPTHMSSPSSPFDIVFYLPSLHTCPFPCFSSALPSCSPLPLFPLLHTCPSPSSPPTLPTPSYLSSPLPIPPPSYRLVGWDGDSLSLHDSHHKSITTTYEYYIPLFNWPSLTRL